MPLNEASVLPESEPMLTNGINQVASSEEFANLTEFEINLTVLSVSNLQTTNSELNSALENINVVTSSYQNYPSVPSINFDSSLWVAFDPLIEPNPQQTSQPEI